MTEKRKARAGYSGPRLILHSEGLLLLYGNALRSAFFIIPSQSPGIRGGSRVDSGRIGSAAAHFHTDSPALKIHSKYPFSSRSICCCLRSFRKARRFSTRSRSLANSLYHVGEKSKQSRDTVCRTVLLLEASCLEAGSFQLPHPHLTHHTLQLQLWESRPLTTAELPAYCALLSRLSSTLCLAHF